MALCSKRLRQGSQLLVEQPNEKDEKDFHGMLHFNTSVCCFSIGLQFKACSSSYGKMASFSQASAILEDQKASRDSWRKGKAELPESTTGLFYIS